MDLGEIWHTAWIGTKDELADFDNDPALDPDSGSNFIPGTLELK